MEDLIKRLSPIMRMRLRDLVRQQVWNLQQDLHDWEKDCDQESEAKRQMLGWLQAAQELEQALKEK